MKHEAVSEDFFEELDKPNGGSMVAKILIEDCTEVHLYVGKAINSAYQNPGLPFDLGIRQNLVEQLRHLIEDMGKKGDSHLLLMGLPDRQKSECMECMNGGKENGNE